MATRRPTATTRSAPNPRPPKSPRRCRATVTGPVDDRVTIEADDKEFSFDANGNAVLSGNVVMRQGDKVIRADRLEYDAKNWRAKLTGAVEFSGPALKVRGSSGEYSPALGAQFEGAQFELPKSNARGAARNMQVDASGTVTLEDVSFTTCPLTDRAWEIKSKRIVLDTRANKGTGHGTRVEFKDVPFIYLPWMTFPIGPQRQSGFFFPNIGGGSRNGAEISLPYYWNIRPNADFMAEPVYYAKRGVDFAGELRYLTRRQRGTLDFNYLPNDRHRAHRPASHYNSNTSPSCPETGVSASTPRTSATAGTSKISRTDRKAPAFPSPSASRKPPIATRHWNVRAQIQDFQTIDEDLPVDDRPYTRTPRLLASGDWNLGQGAIDYGFDGELVNFERNVGVTGWRMDVAPRVGLDWSAPGYFVRPSGGFRYTQYSLEDNEPGTDDSPTRSLPFASLDAGLVFERAAGSRGQRRMTLEPRALYLYAPFREQSELPLFDTGLARPEPRAALSRQSLCGRRPRQRRQPGLVRPHLPPVRCRHAARNTSPPASARRTTSKSRASCLPDEPVATRDTSDFIAQVSLSAYKNWNVEAGLQWNPEDTRSERSQLRLQYRPDGDHVLNLSYRTQRDRLEQTEVSGAWPIGKRWNAYARACLQLARQPDARALCRLRIPRLLLAPARRGATFGVQSRGHAGDQLLPAAGTERAGQCRRCRRFPGTHNSRILAGNFGRVKTNYMISKDFSRGFLVVAGLFRCSGGVLPDP